MNAHTLKARANRARILSTATRTIAEVGFAHITRARIMDGTGLHKGSLDPHFATTRRLLAVICNAHAHALLEATGCHDPLDPTRRRAPPWSPPPRASWPASTPTATPTPS